MFLRLTYFTIFLCVFVQVNSTLFFGNHQYDSTVEPSKLGDLFRAKAQFIDNVKNRLFGNSNSPRGGFSVEGSSSTGGFSVGGSGTRGFSVGGSGTGGLTTGGSGPGGFSAGGSTSGSVNVGRTGIFGQNLNEFGESLSSSLEATGRFIDSGIAAGKQYGRTIFLGATIVPKSLFELARAHHGNNAYLNVQTAQDLSYVSGNPEYLFQFVDENGNIIPITAEVAHKLVPGFAIENN